MSMGIHFADISQFMKLIGQIKNSLETPLTDQINSLVVVVVHKTLEYLNIFKFLSRSNAGITTPQNQTVSLHSDGFGMMKLLI